LGKLRAQVAERDRAFQTYDEKKFSRDELRRKDKGLFD
jgi:hypothetical protein